MQSKFMCSWILYVLTYALSCNDKSSQEVNKTCKHKHADRICPMKYAYDLFCSVLSLLYQHGMCVTHSLTFFMDSIYHKRTDVSPQDEVLKPQDSILGFSIALIFDRHHDSSAVKTPTKFQRDMIIITSNLEASRLHEIYQ